MGIVSSKNIKTPEAHKFEAYSAILEMISLMTSLMENPKTIKEVGVAAAQAYALTDKEISERDMAVALLADMEDKKKQLCDLQSTIDKKHQEINDTHVCNAAEINQQNMILENKMRERKYELDSKEAELEKRESDVSMMKQQVDVAQTALEKRHSEVKELETRVLDLKKEIDGFKARIA